MPLGEPAEGLRDGGLVDETQVPGAVEGRDGGSRFLAPDGSHDRAIMWYARGYYYEAKRRGMLVETGLRPG